MIVFVFLAIKRRPQIEFTIELRAKVFLTLHRIAFYYWHHSARSMVVGVHQICHYLCVYVCVRVRENNVRFYYPFSGEIITYRKRRMPTRQTIKLHRIFFFNLFYAFIMNGNEALFLYQHGYARVCLCMYAVFLFASVWFGSILVSVYASTSV